MAKRRAVKRDVVDLVRNAAAGAQVEVGLAGVGRGGAVKARA